MSIGFGNCFDSVVFFSHFSFMAITEDGRKKNETLEIDIKKTGCYGYIEIEIKLYLALFDVMNYYCVIYLY